MTQPPAEDRDPGTEPGRDPRLPGFAQGGAWDACPPSATLAAVLEEVSGPDWRCPDATDDELVGVLRRWLAVESWVGASKLGVIQEMFRREELPGPVGQWQGGVQGTGLESLLHELALALGVSVQSADKTLSLARELGERLPGVMALLADGTLTYSMARTVADELAVLSDVDAARAEALIIGRLAGKTCGQVGKLAAQAACTVDPEGAEKRRRAAERDDARVRLWRQQSGATALAGSGLPSDEALAAFANVGARAAEYKGSRAFPDAGMDQLRVMAYLDLLNGIAAADRIARAVARAEADARSAGDEDADPGPDADGPGPGPGPGPDIGGGPPPSPSPSPSAGPEPGAVRLSALADLIVPLRTLLGWAGRPGEGHGLGPLDPGLARELAAAAALSLRSEWCVTVVDSEGIAIGHGCARAEKGARPGQRGRVGGDPPAEPSASSAAASSAAFPARVNLTIPLSALPGLSAARGSPGTRWRFTPRDDPGPPDGYGTWTLTLPGGREFTVRLGPVPVFDCDHRYESHAYQPNDTLRHLVQVRDGECTFPPCSRHARESDLEQALPYDQGGRTCTCNAGARSRGCHRVKQSPGWNVTQPRPGWHQWTTPSGRRYTQGPKRYPA